MTGADVIVVGGGSAGAVLAARLSEDPRRRVLLLEAGQDHRAAQTPAAISGPSFLAACAEPGRVFPDLAAVHHEGQQPSSYLRGRGIGGSSAVNAMFAMRGLPEDYDRWSAELGCTGWSWAELRPWFLRVEDDMDYGGDAAHGSGGPLPLHRLPAEQWSDVERALRTATADAGYPWCPDYHQPGAVGFGPAALTVRDGARVSGNDAYLEPARDRPNLTVRGDTLVDRVLFDGRRATGVRTAAGEEITAPLVVVCAGSIHSPAILLRSGVDDRPVGQNLIEHPLATLVLTLADPPADPVAVRPLSTVLRYTSGLADAGPADMQILSLAPFGLAPPKSALAVLGVTTTRVFSRGRVTLADPSPHTDPRVEFAMLTDDRDRERLRDGFRRLVQLADHPAVARLASTVTAAGTPLSELGDTAALDAWLDATVQNYVHAVGTCRMGAPTDPAAVVDPAGGLIGYQGVHVADASVLPDMPRANTNLTVVAVAERLADLLAA